MILIKNLKCTLQIIWKGLTAKEEIFTKYSCERERERGNSTLCCLQFWKEMSAYLRLPLRTKQEWKAHKDYRKHTTNQQILEIQNTKKGATREET